MTIIYTIAVAGVVTLFYFLSKRTTLNKKPTCNTPDSEPDLETTNETPLLNHPSKIDLLTSGERPAVGEKNKWLYPTSDFGKMEDGVVK